MPERDNQKFLTREHLASLPNQELADELQSYDNWRNVAAGILVTCVSVAASSVGVKEVDSVAGEATLIGGGIPATFALLIWGAMRQGGQWTADEVNKRGLQIKKGLLKRSVQVPIA